MIIARFLEIVTESGHFITLTQNHLIFEKTKGYIKAEYIKFKDELQVLMSNNGSKAFSKVISIKEKIEAGWIAPLVDSGHLLVDGILASCYAGVNSHKVAHIFIKPLIYWNKFTKFMNFEQIELDQLQKGQYLNPYVASLKYLKIKKLVNLLI